MANSYLLVGYYEYSQYNINMFMLIDFSEMISYIKPDLVDEESPQSWPCPTAECVDELEALDIVAALHLLPRHVRDGLHEGGSVSVETLCPVVTSPGLKWYI